jgi:RNA polymerase sigma-70 factor (sigma-E family)
MKFSRPTSAPEEESDAELSFRQFVAARWSALQRYAFLLTGDQQAAEDVVQIALEQCWRRWRQIRSESPEAYVRAAVANTAASRRRRRRLPERPLDDLLHPPVAPGDHAESQAVRSGLWLALADLPPRRRTVVVLRIWEDRSVAETAQILGISTGAVKSQLSKAMVQLRSHPQIRGLSNQPDAPLTASATPRPEVSR